MNACSLRVITQQVTGVGVFLSVARSHNSTFPVERGTLCSLGHPAEPLHRRGNQVHHCPPHWLPLGIKQDVLATVVATT